MRRLAVVLVLLSGCRSPVQEAEAALKAQQPLEALRVARDALKSGKVEDETARKRLGALLQVAAHQLLDAPDPAGAPEARELLDAMPEATEERQRAAQRLFRVQARSGDEPAFKAALQELAEPMGDDAAVRSNLRSLSQSARGQPVAVWAAQEVVRRWPEDADRWLDLAAAQAAVRAFGDARASVERALEQLTAHCAELPARLQGYDEVRRKSAYGQLEIQRCQGFHRLALAWVAYAQQQAKPGTQGRDVLATAANVTCPTSAPAWTAGGTSAVVLTPGVETWWVDGQAVPAPVAQLSAGTHRVQWREKRGCREARVEVADGEALALRTAPLL